MSVNEQKLMSEMDVKSRLYSQKYESKFRSISENSRNFGKFRKFSRFDAVTLGNMFERFKSYERYCRENGSASGLGSLPAVALDLVSAVYGTSIAPIISSMQDLPDESGLVYFKKAVAQGIAGGVYKGTSPGDQTMNAKQGWVYENRTTVGTNGVAGSIGEYLSALGRLQVNITAGQTTDITGNFGGGVVLRTNMPINVVDSTGTFTGIFLNGQFLNNKGLTGTVNYNTGDFTITGLVAATFPAATVLTFTYNVDFEKSDTLPQVEFQLDTKTVFAEVLALGEQLGTLKAFQFNQRFGRVADDEVLQDLTGHMAAAESNKAIAAALKLIVNSNVFSLTATTPSATGDPDGQTINWYKQRPTTNAISEFEHRQSFRYALATADSVINVRAGRGFVNRYIAGNTAVEYFRSLNGWTPEVPNTGIGAYVYGYLDGIPVIRASQRDGVDPNTVIGLYVNPSSPFEAPIVTATFMPIFFTNTILSSNNPLQGQKAVAAWKAFEPVVNQFAVQIKLIDSVAP